MSTVSLNSESTTLKIKNITLGTEIVVNDFIAGDYLTITPINPASSRTYSQGGVNIQGRVDKDVRTLSFTVNKFGTTDEFFNEALYSGQTCIFEGSAKTNYTVNGEPRTETYSFSAGSLTDIPEDRKNNVDGNNEMAYAIEDRITRSI